MKLLLLNQNWFAEEFRAAGHEVAVAGFGRQFEVRFDYSILHIDTIIKSLPNGFNPDAIIVYDESSPWFVAGLEETSRPVLFYSVDTQHHAQLHRYLGQMADHTFVVQKDFSGPFLELGMTPEWLPLWASRIVEARPERDRDVCFIGNMNRELNRWRVEFFEELQKLHPVFIAQGQYWDYFPTSEIVINQTVKGDLNFRVFEAMMCGTLLLTERCGNGLDELFREGEHLVTYERGNAADAAQHIQELLADRPKCRSIAEAGREEILARHLPKHRADTILKRITALKRIDMPMRHVGAMVNFSGLAASSRDVSQALCTSAVVHAMKAAEMVLARHEPLPVDAACHLIRSAMFYDQLLSSRAGEKLIATFGEAYPEVPVLALATIRSLLNQGQREDAERWVRDRFAAEPSAVFGVAERIITQLLERTAES